MTAHVWYSYVKYTPENRPFYVGKGCGGRVFVLANRSKGYLHNYKKYGAQAIRTVLLFWDTEQKALASEKYLIQSFLIAGHTLENIHLKQNTKKLSRYNRILPNAKKPSGKKVSHITEINRVLHKKFGIRLPMSDIRRLSMTEKFPRGTPTNNPQFWNTHQVVRWVENKTNGC